MSWAIPTAALLLALGVCLRQSLPLLQRFFIPASVIAGFVGLGLVRTVAAVGGDWGTSQVAELNGTFSSWPGPLIAIVFAAMLLHQAESEATARSESKTRRVARQGLMVWIIVLGETMVGLVATWLFILPYWDVPHSFGLLIETGFAGGHGTAAAMGQVFASDQVGFPVGLDLGMLMATCGLVYGVVSGIFWINLAAKIGWFKPETCSPQMVSKSNSGVAGAGKAGAGTLQNGESGSPQSGSGTAIGFERLTAEVIDPLLLQAVWIGLAVGIGMLMQAVVLSAAGWVDGYFDTARISAEVTRDAGAVAKDVQKELSKRLAVANLLDFPLFIYTMFGGLFVRKILQSIGQGRLIDSRTIQRMSATAMEILVVAAITSLQLSAIAGLWGPFLILVVCGGFWTALCLMVLSRWVLPREHWFPLALINYGMSTGTTATGFVLLRVVDPELKSEAASDYALAAPLSAPFIGGGILTIALPLVLLEKVAIGWPLGVITLVVGVMIAVGAYMGRES